MISILLKHFSPLIYTELSIGLHSSKSINCPAYFFLLQKTDYTGTFEGKIHHVSKEEKTNKNNLTGRNDTIQMLDAIVRKTTSSS